MPAFKDITGQRFTRLVALAPERKDPSGRWRWLCQCDCGQRTIVSVSQLTRNRTRSCGCLKRELDHTRPLKHGYHRRGTDDKTYQCWQNMLSRCRNPRVPAFQNYGGRGITVCERWLKFENFVADLGECPPGLTIERVDNDLGYSPANCVYASYLEQAQNKRRHGRGKLTPEDVLAIRADPRWQKHIAADYGVTPSAIGLIKRRKNWRYI